jgi:hypothetical protein
MKIKIATDLIAELLCLLTALFCFNGLKAFKLLPFIPFLLFVCGIEFLALQKSHNGEIYNLYVLIAAMFYLYCYSVLLELTKRQTKNYWFIGSMVVIFLFLNYLFKDPAVSFTASGMMVIELVLICLSCIVLYQIALNPDGPPLIRNPKFIIASVTFIHCLGGIIIFNFQGKLNHELGRLVNELTMSNLNLVMYPGYIYSFYLCQQQKTRFSE